MPRSSACISDANALTALNKRVDDSAQAAHIEATPTFVVNGKPVAGYRRAGYRQGDRRCGGRREVNLPRLSVLGVAFAFAAMAGAARAVPAHEPDDMALGSPKAPVTVIEYASVGCPHCAAWNNQVFPSIQAKYVDTGKVRLIVREDADRRRDPRRGRLHAGALRGPGEVLSR